MNAASSAADRAYVVRVGRVVAFVCCAAYPQPGDVPVVQDSCASQFWPSFLRSGEATRLHPGESATWRVTFAPLDVRPGDATVDVSALVASTRDLSKTAPDRTRLGAEARLRLVRKGRCFDVLDAGH